MGMTYYEILGVSENASTKEIREAHRRLIFEYHPDRNKDPAAPRKAARINEAYSTLSVASKRALYDQKLKLQRNAGREQTSQKDPQDGARTYAEPPPMPDYRCERCGCSDTTIRMALFHQVVSMIFLTRRSGKAGIWCSRCRAFLSAKYSLVTALLGWWGVPWGFVYTLGALFSNAGGGEQPKRENATILSILAYKKYQERNYEEAYWALKESVRLHPNAEFAPLLEHLKSMNPGEKSFDFWGIAAAVPAVIISVVIARLIYGAVTAPSGYEARYIPPAASVASVATPPPVENSQDQARKRVNALVDQLATIVEDRAPVIGTYHRGNKIIRQHVLDRSKFDAAEIDRIASSIYADLQRSHDPDGFIASSYFNAKILALSIDIVNAIDNGQPIVASAKEVLRLGKDDRVAPWLESSVFRKEYYELCGKLSHYQKQYIPGKPFDKIEAEWTTLDRRCEEVRAQLDEYRAAENYDAFNGLVDTYNETVRRTNSIARQLQVRSTAHQKLDLAFNRCLDRNIIMSKFSEVNLTSHAQEVDSIPEIN